jgi:hypothetical protein
MLSAAGGLLASSGASQLLAAGACQVLKKIGSAAAASGFRAACNQPRETQQQRLYGQVAYAERDEGSDGEFESWRGAELSCVLHPMDQLLAAQSTWYQPLKCKDT